MTELWKINKDGCIEAIADYEFYHPSANRKMQIKAGDVGAKIEIFVKLPSTTEKLWVGKGTTFDSSLMGTKLGSCFIGDECQIDGNVRIKDDVMILHDVRISFNVVVMHDALIEGGTRIGNNTSIYERSCIRCGSRISSSVIIGSGTRVGMNATIWEGVKIYRSHIGKYCEINRSVYINDCAIGDYSVISRYAILNLVQAASVKIGENVKLSNTKLPDRAEINLGDHFMLAGCGKHGRNVLFFTHENEVCVSAGCQIGITHKRFKERIRHAHGTTEESVILYKQIMPILNAIIKDLKWKIFKKKVRNFFS